MYGLQASLSDDDAEAFKHEVASGVLAANRALDPADIAGVTLSAGSIIATVLFKTLQAIKKAPMEFTVNGMSFASTSKEVNALGITSSMDSSLEPTTSLESLEPTVSSESLAADYSHMYYMVGGSSPLAHGDPMHCVVGGEATDDEALLSPNTLHL